MMRFLRYAGLGIGTFSIDFALLYVLTSVAGVYYLLSTAIAFIVAATLNYIGSRSYVFAETERGLGSGYVWSIAIACVGLVCITGLMYVFVEYLRINYLVSRVIVAACVGSWGYLMNLHFNFKVSKMQLGRRSPKE